MTAGVARLGAYDLHCLAVETPARPLHVGVLATLDGTALLDAAGRVDLAGVRARLVARVEALPELRRVVHRPRPLAGRPIWVEDPAFRIERHVDAAEAAAPGDEGALRALVEALVAEPLPRDRPLWRMWLLTGLQGGRIGVLLIVHHALADGLTTMRLARDLLETPGRSPGRSNLARVRAAPAWGELVLDHLASTVASVLRAFRPSTWRTGALVVRAAWAAGSAARRASPSSLNAPVGPHRRLEVLRIDAGGARRIARGHGCGVTDVVLGLVTGGIRDLLIARGEAVDRARPRAGVAVGLFSAGRVFRVGNDIGTIHVPLPVGEPDAGVRLGLIAAERGRALASPLVAVEPVLRAAAGRLGFVRRSLERQRLVNLAVTCLPGPVAPIEVLGAPVLDLVPVAPLAGNIGLSIVALSYAGRLAVTVRADAAQFPDLDVLVAAMGRDWRLLAAVRPIGSAARTATPVAA